jgi:transketolase
MRVTFARTLAELAGRDPRIVLLTGDLGYIYLSHFSGMFPGRFINAGVAEQNMVGMACGMAESGLIPFAYSISTFAALRPYEFFRNGAVHHRFQVRLVGAGGGFEYGINGPSHYGLEDVGVMRVQPGAAVLVPADPAQLRSMMLGTWDLPGPVYYRLGKDEIDPLPGLDGRFSLGRIDTVAAGRHAAVVSMGPLSTEAAGAVRALSDRGLSCELAVASTISPPPTEGILGLARRFPLIFTVEEHYITGGLGSMVSEIVAGDGVDCRVVRLGVGEGFDGKMGNRAFMLERHGLSARGLAESIWNAWRGHSSKKQGGSI